ncbi:MAG: SCO family protein, partial [Thermoflexales bacterium]|nr:SCO family protein [Thermoflexales bacterium]
KTVLPCALLATTLFLAACTPLAPVPTPEPTFAPRAIRVDYPITPPDVPMLDQHGHPAKLSDFRGRPALIFFGNVRCAESCINALPQFKEIKQALGPRSAELTFVMVGADRTADGPSALKRHLRRYDPAFVGLTAERSDMRQLALRFGIHMYENPDGLLVPHAPFIYLLDRQGRLLYFIQDGVATSEIVRIVREVLDES